MNLQINPFSFRASLPLLGITSCYPFICNAVRLFPVKFQWLEGIYFLLHSLFHVGEHRSLAVVVSRWAILVWVYWGLGVKALS